MSITSSELRQIAERIRAFAVATRKAAEAKDLDAEAWHTVDVCLDACDGTATNLDGLSGVISSVTGFIECFPDLQ